MHYEPEEEIPPPRALWMPQNFGGLPPEFSRFASARAVVLPVPYDLTTSYLAGTRFGPQAIIDASTHLELYDEELQCEPYRVGIHTLPPWSPLLPAPKRRSSASKKSSRGLWSTRSSRCCLGASTR
jgi:agmatinase